MIGGNKNVDAYNGSFCSQGTATAGTPIALVAAGSNTNGVDIEQMSIAEYHTTSYPFWTILAKATAPTTLTDGDVLLAPSMLGAAGTAGIAGGALMTPLKVASGKGIWFFPNIASTGIRSITYRG